MSAILSITYDGATLLTPSDTTGQGASKPYAAFYARVAGDVAFIPANGSATIIIPVAAGVIVPIAFKQILATLTTATGIYGLRASPFLGNP